MLLLLNSILNTQILQGTQRSSGILASIRFLHGFLSCSVSYPEDHQYLLEEDKRYSFLKSYLCFLTKNGQLEHTCESFKTLFKLPTFHHHIHQILSELTEQGCIFTQWSTLITHLIVVGRNHDASSMAFYYLDSTQYHQGIPYDTREESQTS